MMLSCFIHNGWTTCIFFGSRHGRVISWKQIAMIHKESHKQKNGSKRDIQKEKEERYRLMLQNLRAESRKPTKYTSGFFMFTDTDKAKNFDESVPEDKVSEVSYVIQTLKPPALYLTRSCSHSRALGNHEYLIEVIQPLTNSVSYNLLCLKLNIPYHFGTGFKAHEALMKLCTATKPGESIYKYRKETAAINELFKVVAHNIKFVDTQDVMNLIHFRYIVKDFSKKCYRKVFTMFVQLMRDDKIEINSLLDFLETLKKCDTSKFTEFDIKDFDAVIESIGFCLADESYKRLSLLKQAYNVIPQHYRSVILALDRVLIDKVNKLEVCEAFLFHNMLYKQTQNATVAKHLLSRIGTDTKDKVALTDIENMIPVLMESHYVNSMLLDLFDKAIASKNKDEISAPALMQMLSYCTFADFYCDSVFDAACTHYVEDQEGYSSQQLHILLKALGTLNFIPEEDDNFFTKVELQLMNNFNNINILQLLEMIVFLIYLDRFPVKLIDHILTDNFLGSISRLQDEEKLQGERYARIIRRELSSLLELKQLSFPVDQEKEHGNHDTRLYEMILPVITNIVRGKGNVDVKRKPTGSGTYLEIPFNLLARSLNKMEKYPNDKLAFLVMTNASFCKNKESRNHMLGEEMANIRLLQEDGLTVAWTRIDKIEDLKRKKLLSAFVRQLLLQMIID